MTNNLSQDITSRGQELADNLNAMGVDDADVDNGLKTLVRKVLGIGGVSNSLTIEVPLNLIYSDQFNITGTLTDSNNTQITGATIKLNVGSTVVDTQTTNNNGVVSFTITPVSMGNHSFQLVYDGDSSHRGCESSVVSRIIGKETSVLTVDYPVNNSSYYSDGSITVSGTLLSDDAEAIAGKSIVVSENNTTLATLTTGNDGSFSGTVSGLSVGTHSLTIAFATDTYYTASSASRTVVVSDPNISLTVSAYDSDDTQISSASSSAILSYVDGDYAVLTATYTGANVSGKTVSFDIVENGVVVENIGSATTDSSGVCSVQYQSKDAGSINIKCSCNNVSSTSVQIEDIYGYRATGSETFSTTMTFNSIFDLGQFHDCEISATLKSTNANGFGLAYKKLNDNVNDNLLRTGTTGVGEKTCMQSRTASTSDWDFQNFSTYYTANNNLNLKITVQNGTVTFNNDTNSKSFTLTLSDLRYVGIMSWGNAKTVTYTDLKVKSL